MMSFSLGQRFSIHNLWIGNFCSCILHEIFKNSFKSWPWCCAVWAPVRSPGRGSPAPSSHALVGTAPFGHRFNLCVNRILHGFLRTFPLLLITGIRLSPSADTDKLQYFREHTLNFPLSCNLPHLCSSVLNKTLWVSLMPPAYWKSSLLIFSCHSIEFGIIKMQIKTWLRNSHTPLCALCS